MSSVVKKAREIAQRLYERNFILWNDLDREIVFAIQALNAEVQRLEALAQPYRAVKTYHEGQPVYVAQPAQRPWVGLTHQQTKDCMAAWDGKDAYVLCRAIEAKLKEKNT